MTNTYSGMTPGAILSAARQQKGLTEVDIASRLCLSVPLVEDIEKDDYSHMAARVYARGHVISYAHLLEVPKEQIIEALNNVNMHFEPPKNPIPFDNDKKIPIYQSVESSQQHSSVAVWCSVLVLIILAGLALMWWKGQNANNPKTLSGTGVANSTVIPLQSTQPTGPLAPATTPSTPTTVVTPPVTNQTQQPVPSTTAPNKPAPVKDQTALQPSEFKNSPPPGAANPSQNQPQESVQLPEPRASNNE